MYCISNESSPDWLVWYLHPTCHRTIALNFMAIPAKLPDLIALNIQFFPAGLVTTAGTDFMAFKIILRAIFCNRFQILYSSENWQKYHPAARLCELRIILRNHYKIKSARRTNNRPPAMSKRGIADAGHLQIRRRNQTKSKVAGDRRTVGEG